MEQYCKKRLDCKRTWTCGDVCIYFESLKNEGWNNLSTAPRNATWFEGLTKDYEIEKVHYASDLSGEDQPPFQGFFKKSGGYNCEVNIIMWREFQNKSCDTCENKANWRCPYCKEMRDFYPKDIV